MKRIILYLRDFFSLNNGSVILRSNILIAAFILVSVCSFAGGNDRIVKDTVINKISYHIYEGSRGGKYIIVTSKAGNTYKKYFKAAK